MYRGFIKNITNLNGNAIGSADLRILSMDINRDLMSKATSRFEVINIPTSAENGNVFGVYDDYGETIYLGVINSIDGTQIQCDQIISIFDDKHKWSSSLMGATIEETIENMIIELASDADSMLASIFNSFVVSTNSATPNTIEVRSDATTFNMMEFLIEIYNTYGVMVDINIEYTADAPSIDIGVASYPLIQIGNNTQAFRNFSIIRETQENNKLIVYSKDGTSVRGRYYATTSGITTNPASLNRLAKINTTIVYDDDTPLDDIVADNLNDEMFNHKIDVGLVLKNKLYDFNSFHLGQTFKIFYNSEYYDSILTGYSLNINNQGEADVVELAFGKVRYTLASKIYQLMNSETTSIVSGSPSGVVTDVKVNGVSKVVAGEANVTSSDVVVSTTHTNVATRTSGASTIDYATAEVCGKMCQFTIRIVTNGSTASGSSVLIGTMDAQFRPKVNAGICGYSASRAIIGLIETDGTITLRNCGSSALSSGSGITLSGAYFIN